MTRTRFLLLDLTLVLCALCTPPASAQTPHTDVGFTEWTPLPDADLVVVRERSYGASGVDLTAYGIGTGLSTYVQSIYIRFRKGQGAGTNAWFRARVTFPPGVEVLGVISDGAQLGGSSDDGALTDLDLIFGIDPVLADRYSAPDRGLEADDFAYVASPTEVFIVHGVTDGVDDVRIVIGYGGSFPASATFDIDAADVGVPSADPMSLGVIIGAPGGAVPGSGDKGEARSVLNIPLTGMTTPFLQNGFGVDMLRSVFIARGGNGTRVDVFDVDLGFPVPAVMGSSEPSDGVAFAQGPYNSLYTVAAATGAAYFQVESGGAAADPLNVNLPGDIVGVTGDGGEASIWLARDRLNGDSHVDRVRASDTFVQQSYAVDSTLLPEPVGITDAQDAMLYVLGRTGELIRFDPATGAYAAAWTTGQGGDYAEIGRDVTGSTLYLLRDAGATSEIDVFDVASGTGQVARASFAERSPSDVCGGPNGGVYVVGEGDATQPHRLWIANSNFVVTDRLDLSGLNGVLYGISNFVPGGFGVNYCGPAVPNSTGRSGIIRADGDPSAGGTLRLSAWDLPHYQLGYFLGSQGTGTLYPVPGSEGRLCLLGSTIGRFSGPTQVRNTGVNGRMFLEIDTGALPLSPPVAAQVGETWNFQGWHRDNAVGTSHFTDATGVTFQ